MSGAISSLITETADLMKALGVKEALYTGGTLPARSAISGEILARVPERDAKAANEAVAASQAAFNAWRNVPAPKRGELIRLLGEELRAHKAELGRLISELPGARFGVDHLVEAVEDPVDSPGFCKHPQLGGPQSIGSELCL